jgi:hypothetical protein
MGITKKAAPAADGKISVTSSFSVVSMIFPDDRIWLNF